MADAEFAGLQVSTHPVLCCVLAGCAGCQEAAVRAAEQHCCRRGRSHE